jgi:large subunit ribosomal protein L22
MPGVKTNERPGTRAVLRHYRMSATKARQVLDLVRGKDVDRAHEVLRATPREAARVVAKVLESAVSNARHNDGLDPDELFVSAAYADEGTTIKRWRPRARGRATRIRKRTCHITVIVSRLPEDRLARRQARQAATSGALRSRRVAASRRRQPATAAESAEAEQTGAEPAETDKAEAELTEPETEQPGSEEKAGPDAEGELEDGEDEEGEEEQPGEDAGAEVADGTAEATAEGSGAVVADEESDGAIEAAEVDDAAQEEPRRSRRRLGRAKKTEDTADDGVEESD